MCFSQDCELAVLNQYLYYPLSMKGMYQDMPPPLGFLKPQGVLNSMYAMSFLYTHIFSLKEACCGFSLAYSNSQD